MPERADLLGGGLHQPVDGVFGRRVPRDARLAELALDRRCDDDPPAVARDHVLQGPPHAPEDVVEVPVDLELPLLVAHLGDRRGLQHAARVQAADVELSEVVDGEVDETFDVGLLAHVAGEELGVVTSTHLRQGLLDPFPHRGR